MTREAAIQVLDDAGVLITGARAQQHGDAYDNHSNIAAAWNAYLSPRFDGELTSMDVALMMALLKIARTKTGDLNRDDYVDLCGYASLAYMLAQEDEGHVLPARHYDFLKGGGVA